MPEDQETTAQDLQLERVASPPPAYSEQAGPSVDPNDPLATSGHPELQQLEAFIIRAEPEPDIPAGVHRPSQNRAASSSSGSSRNPYEVLSAQNPHVPALRRIPSSAQPLVMTWSPERQAEILSTYDDMPLPQIPQSIPAASATQSGIISYSFSPLSANSMLLVPPANSVDSRPLYHISWREDYFMPGSFITTIRQGAHEGGRYVGEFDLKGGTRTGVVRLGGAEKWVAEVLSVFSKSNGISKWHFSSRALFWERKPPQAVQQCKLVSRSREVLASFIPPNYNLRDAASQVCRLEMHPRGQQCFDEILLSSLLMERQRITKPIVF